MTPEEMESAIKELKDDKEKLARQVAGQEDLIQRHKTEIGDARKEITAAMEEVKGIDKEKLQKALDNLETKPDTDGSSSSSSSSRDKDDKVSETPADVRAKMTEEQRKAADDQFKTLPPEERQRIVSDPAQELMFLTAAVESQPYVPESLFDRDRAAGSQKDANPYRKQFGLADEESSFAPGAVRGADASTYAGSTKPGQQEQSPASKRLVGGRIPRPERERKE
jgi:hypothetical protein